MNYPDPRVEVSKISPAAFRRWSTPVEPPVASIFFCILFARRTKYKKTEQLKSTYRVEVLTQLNKFVCAWHNGWTACIKAQLASVEDPTPTGKIYAGQVNGGYMSFDPSKTKKLQWDGIAKVITATNRDLKVDMTGVSSGSLASDSNEKATEKKLLQ